MTALAPFTVLVPAHNEAQGIARTLAAMLDGWGDHAPPRVIVLCNGCTDDTAAIARRAAPAAEVIEIAAASKIAAINDGLALTRAFPVLVVDADVIITPPALIALAAALREPGVMAASPAATFDTAVSDRWTRAFYRVWAAHGFLATGTGGSGVYGLSAAGAAAIGRFPDVTGDDNFVRWSFPLAQQRRVSEHMGAPVRAHVTAPSTLGQLLACEMRWRAGNVQLRQRMQPPADDGLPPPAPLAPSPRMADRAIYYTIKLLGRAKLLLAARRGKAGLWHRGR